jgi:hypothetical protein
VALAALIALAGVAGGGLFGVLLRWTSVAVFVALLVFSASIVQRRLYGVGHDRDPHPPITAIKDFTPRLVGPTKIGNFTVWSFPHIGGIALALGAGLTLAGTVRTAHS